VNKEKEKKYIISPQYKTVTCRNCIHMLVLLINTDIPSVLLNKVLFEILLYFCRRGHENAREMKPGDFEVSIDDNGKRLSCKETYEKPSGIAQ
jgi:hypothetical protein